MEKIQRQLSFSRNKDKQWVHNPDSLTGAHVVYTVKFLGHVEVDQPKGSEMVKEAIRKLKFNKQIRRSEGVKTPKVDLVVSIDSLAIQDPKYKIVQYQYPLHQVSYCADDKTDKRMFTFIAKDKGEDKNKCFVFTSDRSAADITMTVGQAFDLAYKRFLQTSGKNDDRRQLVLCQRKIQDLTTENSKLKEKVNELEERLQAVSYQNGSNGTHEMNREVSTSSTGSAARESFASSNGFSSSSMDSPSVDLFGSTPFSPQFSVTNPFYSVLTSNPPSASNNISRCDSNPHTTSSATTNHVTPSTSNNDSLDVFGMSSWTSNDEKELFEMQTNFSRGLSFGTDDFSLEDFDPLKK